MRNEKPKTLRSQWLGEEGMIWFYSSPNKQTNVYVHVHTTPSLCIMQQIKYRFPNVCAIEIRGVVAKI